MMVGADGVEGVGEIRINIVQGIGEEEVVGFSEVGGGGGPTTGEAGDAAGRSEDVEGDEMVVTVPGDEPEREGSSRIGNDAECMPIVRQNASTSGNLNTDRLADVGESVAITPTQSMIFGELGPSDGGDDGAGPICTEEYPPYTDDELSDADPEALVASAGGRGRRRRSMGSRVRPRLDCVRQRDLFVVPPPCIRPSPLVGYRSWSGAMR